MKNKGDVMDKYACFNDYGEILLPKDLQLILHVSKNTVYKLLDAGVIKSFKIGNSYRIPKRNLIDYLYPENDSD